jgi:hypothetical protein
VAVPVTHRPLFRRKLRRPDGTVLTARITTAEGRALVEFTTAVAAGLPPEPEHSRLVTRLWHQGRLTAAEMDELWRQAAGPDHPFTDHDGMPRWDVILSAFETSRRRH